MRKFLLGAVAALFALPAWAADLPAVKARAVPAIAPVACTISSCTGWYAGAHIEGVGSNADIVGSGINGSIFANGAGLGGHFGFQSWNGSFFFGAEIGATGYTGGTSIIATAANINPMWSADALGKVGIGLGNLFNSAPGGAPPANIIQQLNANVITPYGIVGARMRNFGTGLVTGAGVEYAIGGPWVAFAEYLHVNYEQTVTSGIAPVSIGTENVVRGGVNYMFNF